MIVILCNTAYYYRVCSATWSNNKDFQLMLIVNVSGKLDRINLCIQLNRTRYESIFVSLNMLIFVKIFDESFRRYKPQLTVLINDL